MVLGRSYILWSRTWEQVFNEVAVCVKSLRTIEVGWWKADYIKDKEKHLLTDCTASWRNTETNHWRRRRFMYRAFHTKWNFSSCRFLLLWSAVLIMYPTTLAVIALTFSSYVLQPVFPNCVPPYMATRMLSATCLCRYLILNTDDYTGFNLHSRPFQFCCWQGS